MFVIDPRNLHRLIRTIRDAHVAVMSGVKTLYNALVQRPAFAALDFGAMRVASAAARRSKARWPPLARDHRHRPGRRLRPDRGVAGGVHQYGRQPEARHRRAAGAVDRGEHPGRPWRVLAPGEHGEVWVRGPQVMRGYWRRPDETRHVLTADGWLRTGDIGALDAEGYLKLLDRKKDMVIVSGFKVFPSEVEDIAMQHPGVIEAAVIGVPDQRTGQAVKLFVVRSDPALTEADSREFLHERLVNYKVPNIIEFRDSCRRVISAKFCAKSCTKNEQVSR